MTEEQIERVVEQRTNAIDARYMAHYLTTLEYEAEMAALSRWAEKQYRMVGTSGVA